MMMAAAARGWRQPLTAWFGAGVRRPEAAEIRLINLRGKKFVLAGVDGKKISSNFFRSIFDPTHHSLPFCLNFLVVRWIWLKNAMGGSLACQICLFLAKNSVSYNNTMTNNLLCVRGQKKNQLLLRFPPSCCCLCRCAAAAARKLPPLLLPCCRRAVAAAATLPPPLTPHCHHCRRHCLCLHFHCRCCCCHCRRFRCHCHYHF